MNKILDLEDIQFMKEYINYRIALIQTGILSQTEINVCKIFAKILEEIEKEDSNE